MADKIYHLTPDAEFQKEVTKLGGYPLEIFDQPEFLEFFLYKETTSEIVETKVKDHQIYPGLTPGRTQVLEYAYVNVNPSKEPQSLKCENLIGWLQRL